MSAEQVELVEQENTSVRRSQWQMLGVLSAVFVPMVIAYTLFKTQLGIPDGTINKGELLPVPQQMSELMMSNLDGTPWSANEMKDKWWMVIPVTADCGESCQQSLWVTRQVRTRLNEKRIRVKRLALLLDGANVPEALVEEHPDLAWKRADDYQQWSRPQLRPTSGPALLETAPQRGYFVVDQQGWAMMTYDSRQSGNDLLKDIKRLLRYSYEKE
ncbi:MAG: hypothetical protein K6L73_14260 [Cellvibrionaceae bacterium]